MPPQRTSRVVTLIASATEIVCALGCRDRLVGRSHECDFPPEVRDLPVLTEAKFPVEGASREIDRTVKAVLEQGLSVYRVDAERLKALRPDLIVTQDQCEVCAVSLADVERALCDWADSEARVVSLRPNALADVWRDIRTVGAALDLPDGGEGLVASLEARMAAIARKAESAGSRPRVATIEWIDPLMAGGNWMPELVGLAGGENLFGEPGRHSPWLDWDALAAVDPDVIVVHPCGFDIARSLADMPFMTRRPGWAEVKAVRDGRVFVADGNAYFNRPGPRLVESLEILAELFHPDLFRFGHEGSGWVKYRAQDERAVA